MFSPQALIQPIAVVGTIFDRTVRQPAYVTLAERVFDQRGLMRLSACDPDGDIKTMAVRDCHGLAPLAEARWTNAIARFCPDERGVDEAFFQLKFSSGQQASQSAHKMPSSIRECTQC